MRLKRPDRKTLRTGGASRGRRQLDWDVGYLRFPVPRAGVTLAETVAIVCVLGIVTLLVAPALSDARRVCQVVTCEEKLGQIARAGLAYAQEDLNELAIPIGVADAMSQSATLAPYNFGGKSGIGHRPAGSQGNIVLSTWGPNKVMNSAFRPLNSWLYKREFENIPPFPDGGLNWLPDSRLDLDVYHCPGDQGFPGMHYDEWRVSDLSSYNHFGTSYAASAELFVSTPGPEPVFLESVTTYFRPISQVPNPGKTIMYWENAARFAWRSFEPGLSDTLDGACTDILFGDEFVANGWHGEPWRFNVAFADGHVANVRIKGYGLTEVTGGICGTPEVCACIAIRGDGWQLDTLPAQPIETPRLSSFGRPTDGGPAGSPLEIVP